MARQHKGLRFQPSGGSRAPQVPVGKKQRLTIERLSNDGRGIAFSEGRTWFVAGALAGEEVDARVLGAHGKVVEARSERVLLASDQRRPAPCAHAGRCGGCSIQHMPHTDQLALKQRMLAEQLSRVGGVEPEEWAAPLTGPEFGYRRRARVAVRWDAKAKTLEVGFRAAASQDIVGIDDCPVLVPSLQPIMNGLPAMLRRLGKPQSLGHVELFSGSAVAVLLRHMAPLSADDLQILRSFCEQHGAQLWLQGEDGPQPVDATQSLGYQLEQWNLELAYRPGDFVQRDLHSFPPRRSSDLWPRPWIGSSLPPMSGCLICFAAWAISPCHWLARYARWSRWKVCRLWSSGLPRMPPRTICITRVFFRPIYPSH